MYLRYALEVAHVAGQLSDEEYTVILVSPKDQTAVYHAWKGVLRDTSVKVKHLWRCMCGGFPDGYCICPTSQIQRRDKILVKNLQTAAMLIKVNNIGISLSSFALKKASLEFDMSLDELSEKMLLSGSALLYEGQKKQVLRTAKAVAIVEGRNSFEPSDIAAAVQFAMGSGDFVDSGLFRA
jgi:hypothetical protein